MTRNEKTSARIAKIAGQILATKRSREVLVWHIDDGDEPLYIPWKDFRALAASCLNQAPDRTIRKSRRVARKRKTKKSPWIARKISLRSKPVPRRLVK